MQLKTEKSIIAQEKSKLTIEPFDCRKGFTKKASIDLTPYAGQYVRIWMDDDLSFSTDRHKDHYWQIAEFLVPMQKYKNVDTSEIDENGLPIVISEPIPITLPTIRLFDIEEKEKKEEK